MSDDKMESTFTYSQLQELEDDFEEVEVELRTYSLPLPWAHGLRDPC